MSMNDTTGFIKKLTEAVNEILPATYESAPVESEYCYACVNGVYFQHPAENEDSATFYVDIFANENAETETTVALETYCDGVRDYLQNCVISSAGFYAHIGFEGRATTAESETDLNHRKLTFSAKIIYIGG